VVVLEPVEGYQPDRERKIADFMRSLQSTRPSELVFDPVLHETIAKSDQDALLNHATTAKAFLGLPVSESHFPGGELLPQIELHAAAINLMARKYGIKNIFKEAQAEVQQTKHDEAARRFEEDRLIKENTLKNESKIVKVIEDELKHHTIFSADDGRLLGDIEKEKCPRCGTPISAKTLAEGLARHYPYGGVFDDERKDAIRHDIHSQNALHDLRCTNPECFGIVLRFARFLDKGD
jgi:hypothetical protein